jgi:hypothetical protein
VEDLFYLLPLFGGHPGVITAYSRPMLAKIHSNTIRGARLCMAAACRKSLTSARNGHK